MTQGDLLVERLAEVSRGHSSEEAGRKAGGAKDRRTKETMLNENLIETVANVAGNSGAPQLR